MYDKFQDAFYIKVDLLSQNYFHYVRDTLLDHDHFQHKWQNLLYNRPNSGFVSYRTFSMIKKIKCDVL